MVNITKSHSNIGALFSCTLHSIIVSSLLLSHDIKKLLRSTQSGFCMLFVTKQKSLRTINNIHFNFPRQYIRCTLKVAYDWIALCEISSRIDAWNHHCYKGHKKLQWIFICALKSNRGITSYVLQLYSIVHVNEWHFSSNANRTANVGIM